VGIPNDALQCNNPSVLEPAVTLTDFALFALNAILALRIFRVPTSLPIARRHWVLLFASVSAGALAGAISHGWFPEETHAGYIIWRVTMLLVGIAGIASFLVATSLIFRNRFATSFVIIAVLAWVAYAAVILFVRSDFHVGVMFYVPGALLLLVAFIRQSFSSTPLGLLGASGMLLTFVAAYIQGAGIAINPRYFDHNATYHLVQAVGLLLVYSAGRRWLQSAAPAPATPRG
jgi:hypothetical protein